MVANLGIEAFTAGFGSVEPVYDGDVDYGIARPDLRRDRFRDGTTVPDDVVRASLSRVVLTDGVGAEREPCIVGAVEYVEGRP